MVQAPGAFRAHHQQLAHSTPSPRVSPRAVARPRTSAEASNPAIPEANPRSARTALDLKSAAGSSPQEGPDGSRGVVLVSDRPFRGGARTNARRDRKNHS